MSNICPVSCIKARGVRLSPDLLFFWIASFLWGKRNGWNIWLPMKVQVRLLWVQPHDYLWMNLHVYFLEFLITLWLKYIWNVLLKKNHELLRNACIGNSKYLFEKKIVKAFTGGKNKTSKTFNKWTFNVVN